MYSGRSINFFIMHHRGYFSFLQNDNGNSLSSQLHEGNRSNILLIYTYYQETLDMNIYGAKDIYTSDMEHWASNEVRFTQFYSASSVCTLLYTLSDSIQKLIFEIMEKTKIHLKNQR